MISCSTNVARELQEILQKKQILSQYSIYIQYEYSRRMIKTDSKTTPYHGDPPPREVQQDHPKRGFTTSTPVRSNCHIFKYLQVMASKS
jgi:hypothetical protein